MESTSAVPRTRKWFQFRLRTLLLGMAVLALAMGLGPKLWYWYRVNQAIDVIVEDGIGDWWMFQGGGAQETLDWIAGDIERATTKLMGVVRDDDPVRVYGELCEVVEEVVSHFESKQRALPAPRVRPMREVI